MDSFSTVSKFSVQLSTGLTETCNLSGVLVLELRRDGLGSGDGNDSIAVEDGTRGTLGSDEDGSVAAGGKVGGLGAGPLSCDSLLSVLSAFLVT